MSEHPIDETWESDPPPVMGASFWIRAVAHTIDFMILMTIMSILTLPLMMRLIIKGLKSGSPTFTYSIWYDVVFQVIIAVGVIYLWRKTQTTPGKMLFRLKIVDSRNGGTPQLHQLVVRFVGYVIAMVPIPLPLIVRFFPSLDEFFDRLFVAASPQIPMPSFAPLLHDWRMMIPLMLGYFWILIDPRNRGWHDLMSGTVTMSQPRPLI